MSDDTARDVYDDYMKWFNAGESQAEIARRLQREWRSSMRDDDEGPIVVLATAKAMWDCGHLDGKHMKAVNAVIDQGQGLERWRERGPKALAARLAKLKAFARGLSKPNGAPKKPKPPLRRTPVFRPGDCLAIRLRSGEYAAAIVLQYEEPPARVGEESYGVNVIGQLRYCRRTKPSKAVFEKREWLMLTHGSWPKRTKDGGGYCWVIAVDRRGFRKAAPLFEVVGTTVIRRSDPTDATGLAVWEFAEQVRLQLAWERKIKSAVPDSAKTTAKSR